MDYYFRKKMRLSIDGACVAGAENPVVLIRNFISASYSVLNV